MKFIYNENAIMQVITNHKQYTLPLNSGFYTLNPFKNNMLRKPLVVDFDQKMFTFTPGLTI